MSIVNFQGTDELHLLRASRLSVLMRGCAAILESSEGSADTYALSEPAVHIHTFLSHNWVVSRAEKFLCLALHFNFLPAVLAATACKVAFDVYDWEERGDRMMWSLVCTSLLFILVLCFWQEAQRFLGLGGPTVFLDKTCIHQVDASLQRRGILKLGAFIHSSSSMVAIFADPYLVKLWTVYEMACFISLHSASQLTIIPTFVPKWFLAVFASVTLASCLVDLDDFLTSCCIFVLTTCGFFFWAFFLRRLARARESMMQQIADFDIEQCQCFYEADRPLVYGNIVRLMRATGRVGNDTTHEESLEAFNDIVRRRLPSILANSIGPTGLWYRHIIVIFLSAYFNRIFDMHWIRGLDGGEFLALLCDICYVSASALGLYPAWVAVLAMWCGCCLHLTGHWDSAFVVIGALLTIPSLGLIHLPFDYLRDYYHSPDHDDPLLEVLGHAVLLVLSLLLAGVLYR